MKHFTLLVLFGLMLSVAAGEDEGFAPEFALSRYQMIWQRSPFVVETAAAQDSPLSQRFVLTAVTMMADKPLVFVLDRKTLRRLALTTEPNSDGMALISLVANVDPRQVRANIRAGREEGSIGYDLAALQAVNQAVAASSPASAGDPPPAASETPKASTKIIRRVPINLVR